MIRTLGCLAIAVCALLLQGCGGANDSEVGEVKDMKPAITEEQQRNYAEESRKMMPNMKYKPKAPKDDKAKK